MKKLNLIAPVGITGYGVTGFNIYKTLVERDWEIGLFTRSKTTGRNELETQLVQFGVGRGEFFDHNAPCLNIWHQHDLSMRIGRGKYVAWPIFELDTFDEREIHHLLYPDELIVCSEWAKGVVEKIFFKKYNSDINPVHNQDWRKTQLDSKVHIVNLGIDSATFNAGVTKTLDNKNTVFFNAGKWEIRKGHDILIEAFSQAFTVDDKVELWMMPTNPFLTARDSKNWEDMYLDTPLGKAGKIKIIPWADDHADVAQIMANTDCGVFPSRGEGWNLELLEMMAIGKPVIATGYSAHTEFCDENNCMLIDIDELESAYDGKWFFDQGNWAELGEPQIEQLIRHLKVTHERCQRPGNFVNDSGIETAKEMTWDSSVDKLVKIFS